MSCASKQKTVTYPHTRTLNQVDDYFGTKVSDPYRWLEDLDSEEVLDWAHSQQDVTQQYLDKIPFMIKDDKNNSKPCSKFTNFLIFSFDLSKALSPTIRF